MNFKYFFAIFLLMIVSLSKIEAKETDNYIVDAMKILCPVMKKFNMVANYQKKKSCKEIVDIIRKDLNNCDIDDNPLCHIVINIPTTGQIVTLMGCLATGPASLAVCFGSIGLGALTPFFS